jgi:hypothetical protein
MKVVRLSGLHTGRLYPQEIFLVIISLRGFIDPRTIVQSTGLCQWKIPMTLSGVEPATLRFVAQCPRTRPILYKSGKVRCKYYKIFVRSLLAWGREQATGTYIFICPYWHYCKQIRPDDKLHIKFVSLCVLKKVKYLGFKLPFMLKFNRYLAQTGICWLTDYQFARS